MRSAAVLVAIACATGVARADDPPPAEVTVVELAFGGDDIDRDAVGVVAAARAIAVTACYARGPADAASAVAFVTVDRKGKTRAVSASGSGDSAVDRCLGKALKPAVWPATSRGGAVALRVVAPRLVQAKSPPIGTNPYVTATRPDEAAATGITVQRAATIDDLLAAFSARALPGIKRCYKNALKGKTPASHPWKVRFRIETTGAVSTATAELGNGKALDACVARVIERVTFPAPAEAVDLAPSFNEAPA